MCFVGWWSCALPFHHSEDLAMQGLLKPKKFTSSFWLEGFLRVREAPRALRIPLGRYLSGGAQTKRHGGDIAGGKSIEAPPPPAWHPRHLDPSDMPLLKSDRLSISQNYVAPQKEMWQWRWRLVCAPVQDRIGTALGPRLASDSPVSNL